jgi:hypothetical protein
MKLVYLEPRHSVAHRLSVSLFKTSQSMIATNVFGVVRTEHTADAA